MEWRPVKYIDHGNDAFPTPKIKNHSATHYNRAIYVFGGYDGRKNHNSLLRFDLDRLEWTKVHTEGQSPPGRNGHTATLAESRVVIIGGWLGSGPFASDDTWVLDLTIEDCATWEKLTPVGDPPGPCNMHSADYIKDNDEVVVFRGGNGREYLNDLHCLHLPTSTWRKCVPKGKAPQQRANHSSAVIKHELFIFGGWNGRERLNDLYIMDSKEEAWSNPQISGIPPHPRAGMSLTALSNKLYLFGGSGSSSKCFCDLRVFDRKELRWKDVVSPSNGETAVFGYARDALVPHQYMASAPAYSSGSGSASGSTTITASSPLSSASATVQYPVCNNPPASNPNEEMDGHHVLRARGVGPGRRAGHTSTAVGRSIFIFGGSCGSDYLSDFFYLDTDPVPPVSIHDLDCMSCLESTLSNHFNEEQFSDVTFVVEGRKVYAHRLVLACASTYFRAMFSSGFKETHYQKSTLSGDMGGNEALSEGSNSANETTMHDCSYSSFIEVLRYIYTGRLPSFQAADFNESVTRVPNPLSNDGYPKNNALSEDGIRKACETLELADRFMLDHLKQAIESILSHNVTSHTCASLMDFALECQATQLACFCEHFQRNEEYSATGFYK